MALYTAAQIKDYTSVNSVSTWTDAKILLYQAGVENIITSLNLDSSLSGYETAYAIAVLFLFDTIADNPTALRSASQGKVSKQFSINDLPSTVKTVIKPFVKGPGGSISGSSFVRKDIGLR